MQALLTAGLFVVASCASAWAWGDEGHKIVCAIASQLVSSATKAELERLIALDQEFDNFSDSCTWPDHPRKRASEHFVNLPRDAKGLDADACPGGHKCVLTAIESDDRVLSSRATDAKKLEALKFLGHWVGDIHQPLHVSFEDDRGGNKISVTGQCVENLHSSWDRCLVEKAVGTNVEAAATDLLKAITPAKQGEWNASGPRDWANESFAIAEAAVTHYCTMKGTSCDAPQPASVDIDDAYLQANVPIVKERLEKAGVRLAHLLDQALGH